jgi:asparagine synthase (glutamine-hydrolysing)
MGGLAGWIVPAHRAPEDHALLPMLEALAHRHVEGEALLACVDRRPRHEAVMGATLCDKPSGVAIALDGAIANARELRAALGKGGFAFERGTSAELLLRAYQYWDKDLVRQLRGAFALAIWDPRKNRLMLARDCFGEKPLYLQERDGGLYFASEVKALLKAPGARAEVDLQSMRECLARRYVPGQATLFRGIRKLAPATYAMWQFGRLQETRYWVAPDRNPRVETKSSGDAIERFLASFEEAVALRTGGAVLLSGGLDSAALVAVLSRGGAAVRTFSLGLDGDRRSELPKAAEVAKHFGTAHQEIVARPAELLASLGKLVASRDAPLATPSELAVHRLASEVSRSVKSVLTGDGCEEIVGGYRRHAAERFHPGFCDAMQARQGKWAQVLLPLTQKEKLLQREEKIQKSTKNPPFDADPQASSLRRVLYADQTRWLPDQLLERNDRAGAAASVELRMPFVDHRFAECVSALADDQRVRGLSTKWILRQAAKRLMPAGLAGRKAGFRLPVRDWLRNELRDTLVEHLQSAASQTRRYYDAGMLDRLVNEHVKGKNNHETPLWTLLNLEIWHRLYHRA